MIEDFEIDTVKEGSNLTLVTYGALVEKALEATTPEQIKAAYARLKQATGKIIEEKEIAVEVLALQLISPLKTDRLIDSVRKTGRLLVVQEESVKRQRLGAEIVRCITGDPRSFYFLQSPPIVLAGKAIYPHAPQLEKYRTPQVENIADAIVRMFFDFEDMT